MCYCPTPTLHLNLALTGDGAFLFSLKKTHSVWFISVLNYGDTENVLINHLLLVIPMSYPCHYTNLCPHKPHKHAHTHTHIHTHTHTHTHTSVILCHTTPSFSLKHTHTLTHSHTHILVYTPGCLRATWTPGPKVCESNCKCQWQLPLHLLLKTISLFTFPFFLPYLLSL